MTSHRILRIAALLACLAGLKPAHADEGLTAQIMEGLARIPARRASFDEQKLLSALTIPLRSSGTLEYRRPDYLEKLTTAPQPERLVVQGETLSIKGDDGAERRLDLNSQPALRAMVEAMRAPLAGDAAALRRSFVLQSTGALSGWQIVLTPSTPEARRFLRQMTLDGSNADILRIDVVQANGDEQIMTIRPNS